MTVPIVNKCRKAMRVMAISNRFLMMALLTTALMGGISGCRRSQTPVVPRVDTPREQASIAHRQYIRAMGTADEDLRRQEYLRSLAAFDVVVKSFPDDREFTPPSHLMKADLHFRMRDYRRAESEYREVVRRYPDIGEIHAGALYGLGDSLYELRRFREGKEAFRQLMDTYGQSDNANIRDRVRMARVKYEEIN